jgi:hypothetical protein
MSTESNFLELFYEVLFKPQNASERIKFLRQENSTQLFFYSILIVVLACLGLSALQGSLGALVPSIFAWLLTVIFFGLFAWLLRPKEVSIDFGSIFFFCAFAQAPLIFLGLSKIWETSAFPTTALTVFCLAWSIVLWGWAISHSLNLGGLKSTILVLTFLLAPFLIVFVLLLFLFVSLMTIFV